MVEFNEKVIKSLPVPATGKKDYWFTGAVLQGVMVPAGFCITVTAKGARTGNLDYRNREGKQRRKAIGQYPTWKPLQMVKEARELRRRVDRGEDPQEEKAQAKKAEEGKNTFQSVATEYLEREGKKLRTADWRKRVLERLVYPVKVDNKDWPGLGPKDIATIKRSDVNRLLDKIEDGHGAVMADRTLATIRKIFNWWTVRDDDFVAPIAKGMARTKPMERARKRVLADDEIRDIWTVLDSGVVGIPDCFVRFQRCLFFAAVRRSEAVKMSWAEVERVIHEDFTGNVWTVPAARMKGKLDHAVPLTPALLALIGERPKDAAARPYVFSTTDGKLPFSSYDPAKKALDKEIAKLREREGRPPMAPWQMQRDARRTARTLMSRAGVPKEHAERVLAHVIGGVEGVYDRFEYLGEKHQALTKLAALIERIIRPPADNVVPLTASR